MGTLRNIGKSVQETLGFATGEAAFMKMSHKKAGSLTGARAGAAETQYSSCNRTPHDALEATQSAEAEQVGRQEVPQREHMRATKGRETTIKDTTLLESVNGDLCVKLAERDHELKNKKAQYRKLKEVYEKKKEQNDLLKEKWSSLNKDTFKLQFYADRYQHLIKNLIIPYAQEKGLQFDDRHFESLDFVLELLLQDAKEAMGLQDKVDELQKELLMKAGKTKAMPDEQLAQEFRSLAGYIKTMSRTIRPYEGTDVVGMLGIGGLAIGSRYDQWSGRVGTKRFLETWTWSILFEAIFRAPFAFFGTEGHTTSNLWFSLFHTEHCHNWPVPSSESEEWRQATMKRLAALIDVGILTEGKEKEYYRWVEKLIVDKRTEVLDSIGSGLRMIAHTVETSKICQIVDKALYLAIQMAQQHSRLQVTSPRIGSEFRSTEMSSLSDDDEDIDYGGAVALVLTPGLTKWGDVHGKNFDHRYDIVRASVQRVAPDETFRGVSLI